MTKNLHRIHHKHVADWAFVNTVRRHRRDTPVV